MLVVCGGFLVFFGSIKALFCSFFSKVNLITKHEVLEGIRTLIYIIKLLKTNQNMETKIVYTILVKTLPDY